MAKKKKDDSWLLLLLLLGLSGLRAIGTVDPTRPKAMDMPTPTGAPPATDGNPSTTTPTDKTGMMDKAKAYMVNIMQNIGITAGSVLDKSMNVSPPATTPEIPTGMANVGVKFAENQVALIASQPVVTTQNGLNLVQNLGDNNASISTAIYNPRTMMYDTYTNNQFLFSTPVQKMNPTPPQAVSPVYPPMSNPPMMAAAIVAAPVPMQRSVFDPNVGILQPQSMQPAPVPLAGLVDPNAINQRNIPPQTPMQQMPMPAPMQPAPAAPSMAALNAMTKIVNPLVNPSNPLAGLESFGQAQLNALLAAGQTLQGAFNNLQNIFPAIGAPITGARPVVIDAI